MACKTTSKGTYLYYDSDGISTYTQLTGVKSLSGPNVSVEIKDQTSLDSTDGWREFCASFKDGGELTAQIYFVKAISTVLYGTLLGATYYWRVSFPLLSGESVNSKLEFQGILSAIGNEVPEDDFIMVPITVKVTGAVTFTAGS